MLRDDINNAVKEAMKAKEERKLSTLRMVNSTIKNADIAARAGSRGHVHRLDVFLVGADVTDMREGEGDDLPGTGGIGQNLLIAGHRGVEADLAHGVAFRAEAKTFQHGAIGEHKERGRFVVRPGESVFGGCHEPFK